MATAEPEPESVLSSSPTSEDTFKTKLNLCRQQLNELFIEISAKLLTRQNELQSELDNIEKRYNDSAMAGEKEKMSDTMIDEMKTSLEAKLNIMSKEAIEIQQKLIIQVEQDRDNFKLQKELFSDVILEYSLTDLTDCITQLGVLTVRVMPDYTNRSNPQTLYSTSDKSSFDPQGITLDNNDNIYITEWKSSKVSVFTIEGVFIHAFGQEYLKEPHYICNDNHNIYVSNYNNHSIVKFSLKGVFIAKIGSKGNSNNKFNRPFGIDYRNGLLYICDMENNRIQIMNEDLEWQKSLTHEKIKEPFGIKIRDNIYFSTNNSLHIMSLGGVFIRTLPHKFKWAAYFTLDNYSNAIISDINDNYIRIISLLDDNIVGEIQNLGTRGIAISNSNRIVNVRSGYGNAIMLMLY